MDQSNSGKKKIMAVVGLLVIVAAIGIGFTVTAGKKSDTASLTTPTPATSSATGPSASSPTVASANTAGYKDGTYSATGSYDTPGGPESLDLSVTIKSGAVTASSATGSGRDHDSVAYQSRFISGYKSLIIGKSIDDISLSRVSGSSLTSQGFNDALSQIKTQAKA
jgi:uncharacterized protein with FMN-binding domain